METIFNAYLKMEMNEWEYWNYIKNLEIEGREDYVENM